MKIGKIEVNWNFRLTASALMAMMIGSGLFLFCYYVPSEEGAFASIENIMHNVKGGALFRNIHMVGASFLFIAFYFHLLRGMYLRSYQGKRKLFWVLDCTVFFLLMVAAFTGYTLPLSQMSGWGITVISHLYQSIPLVGERIYQFILAGDSVSGKTLQRLLVIHALIPLAIFGVVFMQKWAKKITQQEDEDFNPSGRSAALYGLVIFLTVFICVVLTCPHIFTAAEHFKSFTKFETPANIMPEWYFLPYYAQLRAFSLDLRLPFTDIVILSASFQGLLAFFASLVMWMLVPWLDRRQTEGCSKAYKRATLFLIIDLVVLGFCAAQPAFDLALTLVRISTAYYFAHFLIILPLLCKLEKEGNK